MEDIKEKEIYKLTIKVMGNKGDGIGFINQRAIIVSNTQLNKTYKIRITHIKEKYAFGEIIK